jgi:hypothetical protein
MGVGFGMGNMVTNMMNNSMNQQNNVPPPLTQFHVVLNGAQAGPFGIDQLRTMISSGQINRATMVWKAGMANWAAADQQAELGALFAAVPPPIV